MCAVETVKLLIVILATIKGIVCMYVIGAGGYIATSIPIQIGYGTWFISSGVGLVILGLMSMAVAFPLTYAVKRHNRFLLLVCFAVDTFIMTQLISTGLNIQAYTVPQFSKALQSDCLLNTPQVYTQYECEAFYKADRTAGFRLVWEYYYTGISDPLKYQVLTTIQGSSCCGFFAPLNCINDTQSFPMGHTTSGIDSPFLNQRVTCGFYPDFYPVQRDCVQYYDAAAVPPIVGGCSYDAGAGSCINVLPVPTSASGCASNVEDWMSALVSSYATSIIGSSAFNVICMIVSCCMWWKRKETDVFPDFLAENNLRDVNYFEIEDQFEVQPTKDILLKRGYLPENFDSSVPLPGKYRLHPTLMKQGGEESKDQGGQSQTELPEISNDDNGLDENPGETV